MERPAIVVYDANVLYPAPLRDLLIRLAQVGLVQAKWTNAIHDEWIRNVLKDRPELSPERLARTRGLMDAAVRDCLISGYVHLISSLVLPDPDDRHVLAAVIHAHAGAIVTFNLKDFPAEILARHGIDAIHPDDFLTELIDSATAAVVAVVKRQREGLQNPCQTAEELLETFENQGLTQFVAQLRPFGELL